MSTANTDDTRPVRVTVLRHPIEERETSRIPLDPDPTPHPPPRAPRSEDEETKKIRKM